MITLRGQIFSSRTGDDPPLPCVSIQNASVCTFNTSPCVPAPRRHALHCFLRHSTCALCSCAIGTPRILLVCSFPTRSRCVNKNERFPCEPHPCTLAARPEHLVLTSIGCARASQRAKFDKTVVDAQGQWLTVNDQRSVVSER